MRTVLAGLVLTAAMAWSFESRAQLLPPPPMQPSPPGAVPAQPAWGFPPPQPMAPMAPPPSAQQAEEAANSFRGLEVAWANLEVGGGYVGLPSKLGYSSTGAGGPAFGLGAGARFITWTLGARARVVPTSSFTLVQAMVEAGYHLPVGAWDPYLNLRGGYVIALMKQSLPAGADVPGVVSAGTAYDVPNPHGFDLGVSTGDDYYLSALFSLGVDVSFDAMFLSHAALPSADYATFNSASGIGFVVVGSLHAGLHFDL
jgi:hypothetical protein